MPSNADPFVLAELHQHDLLAEAAGWRRAHPDDAGVPPVLGIMLVLIPSLVILLRSWPYQGCPRWRNTTKGRLNLRDGPLW